MIIDSLTSTQLFVEKKKRITITCDNSKNSNGIIEVDDLNNKMISIIDSGDTNLYRLSKYKGQDSVLFYNEDTNKIRLVKEGDLIDIPLDFIKGIKYYVGAKKLVAKNPSNKSFTLEGLSNYRVFKIFLDNGREINSYRVDGDTINIIGNDSLYIDKFSEIIVYLYVSNTTKKILMSKVDYSFVVEYFGYDGIYDEEAFLDGTYFETFLGEEILNFESLELTQTVTRDNIKRDFSNSTKAIINNVDNSIEMSTFLVNDYIDLPHYVGRDEFRIITLNNSFGRIVIINNCMLNDGVSFSLEKEKNTKRYTINCGNYIDINLSSPSYYGKKRYSRGTYSRGTQIYNSARNGGNNVKN